VTTQSTRQFLRRAEVITGVGGNGIEVDDLRIYFKVTKTIGRTPNVATIKIWNLAPDSESLIKGEFDDVILNAGYDGNTRGLFRGNIRYAEGYPDGSERILQLDCGDGDRDFQNTPINVTLAAGTTTAQLVDHILSKFQSVKRGTIAIKDKKHARGRVISAMAPDVLDRVALDSDAHWSFTDGVLHIIPVGSTLPNEAIVITSETGLLETPKRTDKGLQVVCQLNPLIVPNGKIQLDNKDFRDQVRKQRLKLPGAKPHAGAKAKQSHKLSTIDPDGIYKVIRVDHEGDTRGDKWVSEVVCVSLSASEASAAAKSEVVNAILQALNPAGVSRQMIEKWLGHPLESISASEKGRLTSIAAAMKTGTPWAAASAQVPPR
jgi:hypothetical protein